VRTLAVAIVKFTVTLVTSIAIAASIWAMARFLG